MGEAKRTTKLRFNTAVQQKGGMNAGKRENLYRTKEILDNARVFYCDFFLAHKDKMVEKVWYFSKKEDKNKQRLISANELLTWAEFQTMKTKDHPQIDEKWDFGSQFNNMPSLYRRSVIKDSIGRVRSYLSSLKNWEKKTKNKGKPGLPSPKNYPTLYKGTIKLELEELDKKDSYVKIKVHTGKKWEWVNYPVKLGTWHRDRLEEKDWQMQSPKLILSPKKTELHIPQKKNVTAQKIIESKKDPDLVTVAVDLNVRNLAVITVRQHEKIIKTVFFTDKGLDQHRYRHLKKISKKQWQSGKPVKGERSNNLLWQHIKRTNRDFAHKASRTIANICDNYPGCVLLFENLRKMGRKKGSKSHRLNRRLANQIRRLIRDYSKYKAYFLGTVTVEVNPHQTSTRCSCCGSMGERFSLVGEKVCVYKGGKLFRCKKCNYTAHSDFNASVNVHRSFYKEYHWQRKKKKTEQVTLCLATCQVG